MQYSEQIPKFKEFLRARKTLIEQRNQILKDMIPDITKAILSKMDWKDIKFQSIDYVFGEIKVSVENSAENNCRYVFTVEPLEHDAFRIILDFREEYKGY